MLGTFFPLPSIVTARAPDRTGDTSSKARLSVHTNALLKLVVFRFQAQLYPSLSDPLVIRFLSDVGVSLYMTNICEETKRWIRSE